MCITGRWRSLCLRLCELTYSPCLISTKTSPISTPTSAISTPTSSISTPTPRRFCVSKAAGKLLYPWLALWVYSHPPPSPASPHPLPPPLRLARRPSLISTPTSSISTPTPRRFCVSEAAGELLYLWLALWVHPHPHPHPHPLLLPLPPAHRPSLFRAPHSDPSHRPPSPHPTDDLSVPVLETVDGPASDTRQPSSVRQRSSEGY